MEIEKCETRTVTWFLLADVCSFETSMTSWTSLVGRSEFLPNIWKFVSVSGGKTTNVSHEHGVFLQAMIRIFDTLRNL